MLVDPHTAVGLAAADAVASLDPGIPMIVLSTAHPAKFPEAPAAAGLAPVAPRSYEGLFEQPERVDRLPADAEAVKAYDLRALVA